MHRRLRDVREACYKAVKLSSRKRICQFSTNFDEERVSSTCLSKCSVCNPESQHLPQHTLQALHVTLFQALATLIQPVFVE